MHVGFFTVLRWMAIAYCTYLLVLFIFQRHFLYYQVDDNAETDTPGYELLINDVHLRGWVVNPGMANAIIYYGGNAEQLSHTIDVAKTLFSNYSVYLVHYRGYGKSEGQPTEQNLYSDALAVYDDIHTQHNTIAVIGRSLGTGVATYVANERPVSHIVLITPFDSIENIAKARYLGVPVSVLLKDKFESWKRVTTLTAKTLVLVAQDDYVVPRRFTDNLLSYFKAGKVESHVLTGTNHYNISHHPQYYPLINDFLATVKTTN